MPAPSIQSELKALAKLVAKEIQTGRPGEHAAEAREFLDENPFAILALVNLIRREANRKKRSEPVLQAFFYMFSTNLEFIRYRVERGYGWAEDLVADVRERLALLAEDRSVSASVLMILLDAFREAKLDAGDELTNLLGELSTEEAEKAPAIDAPDLNGLLATIAEQVGGNEFDLFDNVVELGQSLPPEFRTAMMTLMVSSPEEVLREAGALFVLDPSGEVRRRTCREIARAAPAKASPVTLRRLTAVRDWLPEAEREPFANAINEVGRNVACAPCTAKDIEAVHATHIDGVGAQSVFVVAKDGRRRAIGCLLVKRGVGVADAWCLRAQTKSEVAEFLDRIQESTLTLPVTFDFVNILVEHHLAVGARAGNIPRVGLLDFTETLGIERWQPKEMTAVDLVGLMEPDFASLNPRRDAIETAVQRSDAWLDANEFADSWFEDDAEAVDILRKSAKRTHASRIDVIVRSVLEPRRAKWTELFLWSALWLKSETRDWGELFAVGSALHGGRPIAEIPAMRAIAARTEEALSYH